MGSPGQTQNPPQDVLSRILQRQDTMDKKLGQLDSIQISVNKITDQVNTMSTKITGLETKMKAIEESRDFDSKSIDLLQAKQKEIDSIMQKMQKLEAEQKEKLLDLQSREMRDNLLFYNFKEERGETDQQCMEKLYRLMEMSWHYKTRGTFNFIECTEWGASIEIKLVRSWRSLPFYPDRERVRGVAKNLEGTSYSIGQQFPKEIQDRRRRLVPIMKKAKEEGKQAYISVDKLYIDGIQYVVKTDPMGPVTAAGVAVTVEPAVATAGTTGATVGATAMDEGSA